MTVKEDGILISTKDGIKVSSREQITKAIIPQENDHILKEPKKSQIFLISFV